MHLVTEAKSFIGRKLLVKEWLDDPELTKERKAVCLTCPMNENGVCKICTCVISVKSQSRVSVNVFSLPPHYEDTHCPLGKWPIRNEDGQIGSNDKEVANYWREKKGKSKLE